MASWRQGLAHEVKNPLVIILQGTEFIKSCIEDEFLADCAERVKNLANRADNIIQGHRKRIVEENLRSFLYREEKERRMGFRAVCYKRLIKTHKGRIFVEGEIGAGTAITIHMPFDNEQGAGNGKTNV